MKAKELKIGTIVISRTDSIGDVVLTLPLCAAIKERYPNSKLIFLAASYTIPVVQFCPHVDEIWDYTAWTKLEKEQQLAEIQQKNIDCFVHVFPRKELAKAVKKAKVKTRIGTSHRIFHWLTCNERVDFTRKSSPLHEAQLNFHLLKPLGWDQIPEISQVNSWMSEYGQSTTKINEQGGTKKIVIHPKSQGSAVEWPLEKYAELATRLSGEGHQIFVTGTEKEGLQFRSAFQWNENVVDTSGKMSLTELVNFIAKADFLLACSTGPLHIAGALQVPCLGLFSPRRPIHPGRWMPLGVHSQTLVSKQECSCESKEKCTCLQDITVEAVYTAIKKKLHA